MNKQIKEMLWAILGSGFLAMITSTIFSFILISKLGRSDEKLNRIIDDIEK